MNAGVVATLAVGAVATVSIGTVLIGLATPSAGADPGTVLLSGPLTPGAVPDPALAPWVIRGGSLCSQIPPAVLAAQMATESAWHPDAVSPAGAQGLAQLMAGTWAAYGADDAGDAAPSPFNAIDAIMAGARYDCALATGEGPLAAQSGTPVLSLVLAAYNAGPSAVAGAGGIPPIPQTQAYVSDVEALAATYVVATPGAFGQAVVIAAEQWIGAPYLWGGGSYAGPTGDPAGFDCSGLVMYAVYQASHGAVGLPHSSEIQATLGRAVSLAEIQPGDVVALQLDGPGDFSHIVIYAGNGQVIAAPHTGANVAVQPLSAFAGAPYTIRRYL